MLGEFEYLILTAVARLQDRAYGAAIREEIDETVGRRCSIGALYITLDRLESKALITTLWEIQRRSAVDDQSEWSALRR
jgi:DNA-binding PadR family transcriptional regulator